VHSDSRLMMQDLHSRHACSHNGDILYTAPRKKAVQIQSTSGENHAIIHILGKTRSLASRKLVVYFECIILSEKSIHRLTSGMIHMKSKDNISWDFVGDKGKINFTGDSTSIA
jgi:hypothetical protein